eukprot:COSAG06_NODE_32090_length_511_cov_1.133495_1_plen_21_part_10
MCATSPAICYVELKNLTVLHW